MIAFCIPPMLSVAHEKTATEPKAAMVPMRPRPPSSRPKRRPCSSASPRRLIDFTIAAQKVNTVVMAKIAWITTSHIKLGMVQNQKPASAVPIQEKTISVLQLNLSARMPPGK